MRFYEFSLNHTTPFTTEFELIKEIAVDRKLSGVVLTESEENDVQEYRDFISLLVTDPSELNINAMYYPVQIVARPVARIMKLECADSPVQYLGLVDGCFAFESPRTKFRLPQNLDSDMEGEPYLMTTTVYETVDELNQTLTLIGVKYAGRWQISQKRLSI